MFSPAINMSFTSFKKDLLLCFIFFRKSLLFGGDIVKCKGRSFPASLVRKVCDKVNSRRFFSKFTPEIFVDFAKVLIQIR